MESLLGDRLKAKAHLTEAQIAEALDRQRMHGGRLGSNLVALGYITEAELDSFFHNVPTTPRSIEETGLSEAFLSDLVMKHLWYLREFSLDDVVKRVKLPMSIVEKVVEGIRHEHMIEVKGAGGLTAMSFRYAITEQGKRRGQELMDISRYVGPAPVTLSSYRRMVEMQTVKNIMVGEEDIKQAFANLVVSERLLQSVGPAVSSGRAIFLYGPPGNGKTTIAETVARTLPETVYVPYAISVGDDLITLYDPMNHIESGERDEGADERWVKVKRPIILAGGELTLNMLDLDFNPIAKFYEAPLQLKANNGMFIVDDFGRQQVDPQQLLNRWIVPLEKRTDFLALQSGMKFEIPFDQLIVFSTNLEPKKLVDEAFLRRIRYKILVDHPTPEQYARVFKKVCASNGVEYRQEILVYLFENFYKQRGVKLNACHPRDLIDHIIDDAHYRNHAPELNQESITAAWENYFVDM